MKTKILRPLILAGLASSALLAAPVWAHGGFEHPHRAVFQPVYYAPAHFHGPRVVYVTRPVVVYPAAPVYYAPAAVYTPGLAYPVGGAIAGAVIGNAIGNGRPAAIAAGAVVGAVIGSRLGAGY